MKLLILLVPLLFAAQAVSAPRQSEFFYQAKDNQQLSIFEFGYEKQKIDYKVGSAVEQIGIFSLLNMEWGVLESLSVGGRVGLLMNNYRTDTLDLLYSGISNPELYGKYVLPLGSVNLRLGGTFSFTLGKRVRNNNENQPVNVSTGRHSFVLDAGLDFAAGSMIMGLNVGSEFALSDIAEENSNGFAQDLTGGEKSGANIFLEYHLTDMAYGANIFYQSQADEETVAGVKTEMPTIYGLKFYIPFYFSKEFTLRPFLTYQVVADSELNGVDIDSGANFGGYLSLRYVF